MNEANEINLSISFVVFKKNKLTGKPKSCGGIDIPFRDVIDGRIHEKWWPLHSISKKVEGTNLTNSNSTIGELYLKLQYNSEVVRSPTKIFYLLTRKEIRII